MAFKSASDSRLNMRGLNEKRRVLCVRSHLQLDVVGGVNVGERLLDAKRGEAGGGILVPALLHHLR